MPKTPTTKETVEENLFGNFKFIDQAVPKAANKAKTDDEPVIVDESPEEIAAKAEALAAAERKSKKQTESDDTDEPEAEVDEPEVKLETEEEPEAQESNLTIFARELADKGLLDLEEGAKIESDEDLYQAYSNTLKRAREEERASKPEDVQKFLEFVDNGGNPADFHKLYYGEGATFEEFVIESDEDREHVVREGLALEGYSEEDIEGEIQDLKDLGKLEKKSEVLLKKLQRVEKEQKKALLDAQKEYASKQEAKKMEQWAEFKKGLFEKEEISGFKFNDKMKTDTWDYMTKIVDRKNNLTQYQIDSASNPDARYMFAYLLKNKWDIKALEKQVTTKAVSKLSAKLSNITDTRTKITKGTPVREKTEDTNPFAGFKSAINNI